MVCCRSTNGRISPDEGSNKSQTSSGHNDDAMHNPDAALNICLIQIQFKWGIKNNDISFGSRFLTNVMIEFKSKSLDHILTGWLVHFK